MKNYTIIVWDTVLHILKYEDYQYIYMLCIQFVKKKFTKRATISKSLWGKAWQFGNLSTLHRVIILFGYLLITSQKICLVHVCILQIWQ